MRVNSYILCPQFWGWALVQLDGAAESGAGFEVSSSWSVDVSSSLRSGCGFGVVVDHWVPVRYWLLSAYCIRKSTFLVSVHVAVITRATHLERKRTHIFRFHDQRPLAYSVGLKYMTNIWRTTQQKLDVWSWSGRCPNSLRFKIYLCKPEGIEIADVKYAYKSSLRLQWIINLWIKN